MGQPLPPTVVHAAAQLPGEVEMIASVLLDSRDDTKKLIYADWLEERGDARASYLRAFTMAARKGSDGVLPQGDGIPKIWRNVLGLTLIERMREVGLHDREGDLLSLARPVLSIEFEVASETHFPLGASRFGGCPDLPSGSEWPTALAKNFPPDWDANKRVPLRLLAQFNLEDFAHTQVGQELPAHGLLSFFSYKIFEYSWVGEAAWLVMYSPDVSNLKRLEPRTDFDKYNRISPPCRLTFTESLDLPQNSDPWEERIGLSWNSDRHGAEAYYELQDLLGEDDSRWHQLLGHTHPCTLGQDPIDSLDWRHLASFGTEERELGWFWGDGDKLYYVISEANLRNRRFDEIRAEEG
jgi:uncharacterized protein (TIGR02996 family)